MKGPCLLNIYVLDLYFHSSLYASTSKGVSQSYKLLKEPYISIILSLHNSTDNCNWIIISYNYNYAHSFSRILNYYSFSRQVLFWLFTFWLFAIFDVVFIFAVFIFVLCVWLSASVERGEKKSFSKFKLSFFWKRKLLISIYCTN